jgi:hypothetical protein
MPFITAFSVSQTGDCTKFTVNDTSSYVTEGTGTFTARRLTIQKSDGTYLTIGATVYNAYVWPFASGNSLELTAIDKDYAYEVTLAHTSSSPQPGSVYTKTDAAVLICFTMSGFYTFSYNMAINPSLEKNYKYVKDVMRLWIEKESAQKAAIDDDFQASQASLDRAKYIVDNLTLGY